MAQGLCLAQFGPRTAEGYEHIIRRHLIPRLGNVPITQLKPDHLQRYYSEKLTDGRLDRKGGLSPRTVRHHHITLHDALQTAVKWGLIIRNPADAVTPPRYQRSEVHILNEDEVNFLLESAKQTPYYALFHTALYTGMRRSELLALRWVDVDLLLCQIHVCRTLHRLKIGEVVFRAPKTAKGRRMVSLSPAAVGVLEAHRKEEMAARIMRGVSWNDDDDLVFCRPDGMPFLPDTVTRVWIRLTRRNCFHGVRLHDARHSHASLMLKAGILPKIVQERLGHASIQTTLDTYSHVTPGLQEATAKRFEDLLNHPREDQVAGNLH